MPAEKNHPVFDEPNNPNIKIWRYMDFTKFVSLLDLKALHFARADLFEDPFEGSISRANVKLRPEIYKGLDIPANFFEQISKVRENIRKNTFISCWHMNEYESAAMWKLYASSNEAISIQSTFQLLHSCLPPNTYVGTVHYIDYNNDLIPENNFFYPFVYKRKSFSHEREVRVILPSIPFPNLNDIASLPGKPVGDAGRIVSVNLDELIENVYIAPTSPTWFEGLVKSVMRKYELNKSLIKCALDEQPIF